MTTIEISPLKPVPPVVRERHRSFMTPTGDYYTVAALPVEYAKELVDLGVRRIITRHNVTPEVKEILVEAGVRVSVILDEEIQLTGS